MENFEKLGYMFIAGAMVGMILCCGLMYGTFRQAKHSLESQALHAMMDIDSTVELLPPPEL